MLRRCAWQEYTTCYSQTPSDPNSWQRILDTRYENGQLRWTVAHKHSESVYFFYCTLLPIPSMNDTCNSLQSVVMMKSAQVTSLGQSLEGRELECITVGTGSTNCWMIHRQHAGESMAEYYAEIVSWNQWFRRWCDL
jgi:murein tripeptide amidase MpaA